MSVFFVKNIKSYSYGKKEIFCISFISSSHPKNIGIFLKNYKSYTYFKANFIFDKQKKELNF